VPVKYKHNGGNSSEAQPVLMTIDKVSSNIGYSGSTSLFLI